MRKSWHNPICGHLWNQGIKMRVIPQLFHETFLCFLQWQHAEMLIVGVLTISQVTWQYLRPKLIIRTNDLKFNSFVIFLDSDIERLDLFCYEHFFKKGWLLLWIIIIIHFWLFFLSVNAALHQQMVEQSFTGQPLALMCQKLWKSLQAES